VFEEDLIVSPKRRRQLPVPEPEPVTTVAPLPRSTRSKRYQGFNQPLVSDKPRRKSHVKHRRVPGKTVTTTTRQMKVSEDAATEDQP
jgi:hypothetical protein